MSATAPRQRGCADPQKHLRTPRRPHTGSRSPPGWPAGHACSGRACRGPWVSHRQPPPQLLWLRATSPMCSATICAAVQSRSYALIHRSSPRGLAHDVWQLMWRNALRCILASVPCPLKSTVPPLAGRGNKAPITGAARPHAAAVAAAVPWAGVRARRVAARALHRRLPRLRPPPKP